jgi:WD40 repeat protein
MSSHVFLSHSSADKPAVEELARRLAKEGIQAWLDKWNLIPGDPWQPAIEKALAESETCAVFVGTSGLHSWQNEEMRAAIDRRVGEIGRHFRVIPVLLPGAERAERSSLPTFLAATTWVEFRDSLDDADAFHRLVCGIRGLEPGPGPEQAFYEGQCPYKGLRVFDVNDAAFFFGREALVQWLLNAVRPATEGQPVNRFLAIVGASGSGKSSLARAGMAAALKHDAVPGSSGWPIVIFRPGSDPLESLAFAVSRVVNVGQGASALADLIGELQRNEKALHRTARQSLPENASGIMLVILVDQFEEIFTHCRNEDLRTAFIRNLLYAAKVAQGQTLVILTMRADFYAKCALNADLAAVFSDHHFLVGPMTDEELRRAIKRPSQLVGCELESGLVELLLHDVRRQAGALPLLQHALLELWNKRDGRRLTVKGYQEIGKLEGALQRRADATLKAFSQAEQELCRRTFLRLTQPGEGAEDTKRRVPMQELVSLSGASGAEEDIVQKLTNACLLTTEGDLSYTTAFVEVAHEALIRSWPQLRKWIDADRAGLRTRTRLTEAARDWKNAGRKPAYLYTDAGLAVAKEWEASHPGELNADEAEFLQCSCDSQQQREASELEAAQRLARAEAARAEEAEKRRIEQVQAAEKLEVERAAAEQHALLAESRRLAAESASIGAKYPQRSLLLAVEAVKVKQSIRGVRVAADEQSLRDALSLVGGRLVTNAHQPVKTVAISADSRWLVTAGDYNTAQLCDLSTEDPSANCRVLRGHYGWIHAATISPDNRWIVTASEDQTARLWDLNAKDPSAHPLVLAGHGTPVIAVAISWDSRWVVTGGRDGKARVWDLSAKDPSAHPLVLPGNYHPLKAVAISRDNRWLFTGSRYNEMENFDTLNVTQAIGLCNISGNAAILWDLWCLTGKKPSGSHEVLRDHSNWVLAAAISADSRWVVTGNYDAARLWRLTDKHPSKPVILTGHRGPVISVAFSSDSRWLVTGSRDNTARLWDLSAKRPSRESVVLGGHTGRVSAVAISPDNRWVVTASNDSTARMWDLNAKDPSADPVVLRCHDGSLSTVAISPDSRWLVTGSYDTSARLWELSAKGAPPNPIVVRGHTGTVNVVATSPDSRWVLTGSYDGTARLWDASTGAPWGEPLRHEDTVWSAAMSPDNRWAVTGSTHGAVRLWDLSAKDPSNNPVVLRGHDVLVQSVAISPDSRWVVSGSADKTARLWDLSAEDPRVGSLVLRDHRGGVEAVAVSPDNRWVVTASEDRTVRVWDLRAKDPSSNSLVLLGHTDAIVAVAISSDSRWVVTASRDNTARVWDLSAKDPSADHVVLRHEYWVDAVAISTDNRWIVTGCRWDTARLWNLRAKDPSADPVILRGHEFWVAAVAISSDSRWAVTGSGDNTARLWDLHSENPTATSLVLRGHNEPIRAVAITANNRWIVTGSQDCTARIWLLQTNDLMDLAPRAVGRNFSAEEWDLYFPGEKYRKTFPNLPGPD